MNADREFPSWSGLEDSSGLRLPVFLIAVHLAAVLAVNSWTLQRYQFSGDEYSCLVSAEIFARGQLSVPSPILPEFFDVVHVLNDGKFYGKYPPGWPLLLSIGCLVGMPWLVNPLIGVGTLALIGHLGRRHFSVAVGNLAMLLCALNPFFIFNDASLFSHTSCLFFITAAYGCLFSCLDEPAPISRWVGLGLAGGMAFLIRPFTAVLLLLPALVVLGNRVLGRDRTAPLIRGLAAGASTFGLCLAAFLAYNRAQTGDAFLTPFQKYWPWDTPGLLMGYGDLHDRFRSHGYQRLLYLAQWLPLTPLLALLAPFFPELRRQPKAMVLAAGFWTLFVGYFFYWGEGQVEFGPRYLFEAASALVLVSVLVLQRLPAIKLPVIATMLILNLVVLALAHRDYSREIRGKRDVYDRVEEMHLSNAIVFLKTGSGNAPPLDLPRNGIDFTGPVLYVHDFGAKNRLLLQEFPGRKAYYYRYDTFDGRGYLLPEELENPR